MKNREIILWTVNIALIGAIILYFVVYNNPTQTNTVKTNITATTLTSTKKISVTNIVPNNTNTSPNKTDVSVSNTSTYSIAEVSTHNNETSCWTIINGKIYDITSYIYSHPAGVNKILQGCGVDATKMYGRVGAHDVSKLVNAFVGNLK